MLTDDFLILETPRDTSIGGVHRIYRFPCGAGLSLVNAALLHSYPFAWEAAVLKDVDEACTNFYLDYTTPLTNDVVVFINDEDANDFIRKATEYFLGPHHHALTKVYKIRRKDV